jgi:2-haloacid dehalogenase
LNLAVLSNGTPEMINDAAVNAGIADAFDALISVETAGAYKPHPHAYALVESRFGITPRQVMFVSGNGWDAAGAAAFGFYSVWINRTAAPRERLWSDPRHELPDLSGLAGLL